MTKQSIHRVLIIPLLVLSIYSNAHPSWGIVADKQGNIYYVDVMHHGDGGLCRINAAHNKLEVIQDNLHAHYLQADNDGNLWAAADIWHQGEIEGEGHHYLVKYNPSANAIDTVFFTDDEDIFFGNNFSVDSKNNLVYFTIHNKIFANDFHGHTTQIVEHEFGWVNTFNADKYGNIWITDKQKDNGTLYKWNRDEGLTTYASGLLREPINSPIFEESNHQRLYAISFDDDGTPLLCDNATRTLRKILADGTVETVYKSPMYWHPIGVFKQNGNYYVMESGWDKNGHKGPKIIIFDENFNQTEELIIDAAAQTVHKAPATKPVNPQEQRQRKSLLLPVLSGSVVIIILVSVIRRRRKKHN